MNDQELKALILQKLAAIAPEAASEEFDPDTDLREQVDIDSMDILNLMIAIHEATGVEIPEADYPKILTLNACAAYLSSRIR